MGVEGVAIGTIAAQYLSAIMIVIYMARLDNCIRFSIKKLCLDVVSIKRMLVIGIPSGVQGVLFSLSNVLIQSSINSFGEWVMAGNSAAANLEGFCYVAMNAVYRAAVTFSGQNMGAKKYKNIKLIAIQTTLCAAVIGIVAAVFILVFRNVLIGLYVSSDNITEAQYLESINAAMKRIFCILPLYFLCGVMESMCGVLRGMGKSMTAMIFSLIGACAFRIIWIETVFKYLMPTLEGIFLSYPISWTLVIMLDVIFFIYYYRKLAHPKERKKDAFIDRLKNHNYKEIQ